MGDFSYHTVHLFSSDKSRSEARRNFPNFPVYYRSEEILPIHLLKAPLVLGTEEKVGFENYC